MGSFIGHVLPGTLFLLVGVWHIWSAVVRHVSNPKSFRVRVWNPVPGFDGKLKYMELYVIVIGAFIDMCIELFYSTHLKFFVNGVLNPHHMNDFEHSGMLLMFVIFGVVTLLSEKTRFLPLPEESLCFIAATAFCGEYLLFNFHSTTHKGLEGYYHLLLVLLIALCVLSCAAGDGCRLKENMVSCHSTDSEVRGEFLANFQLFALVFGVLAGVAGSYIFAASRYGNSEFRSLHIVQDALD
ncbi:hypothetical protein AB3S75_015429 [Citrus x aurantiifolia]